MRNLYIYILCITFMFAGSFIACNQEGVIVDYEDPNYGNEPDEPGEPQAATLSFTSEIINISAVSGRFKSIVIVSNQNNFSIDPASTDWYTTEIIGKDLMITPTVTNSGSERKSQEVTVTAGTGNNTATVTIKIEQNTMRDEPAEISLPTSVFHIDGKAGSTLLITFTTNQEVLTASPDAPWYSSSFNGNIMQIQTLEANPTAQPRTYNITVVAGVAPNTAEITFSLTQAVKPELDPLIGTVIDGGVIYDVDRASGKYKAVALIDGNPNTNTLFWQQSGTPTVATMARDDNDGRNNVVVYKAQSNYPVYLAIKYCDDKSPAQTWYLPARNEVQKLYDMIEEYGRDTFNSIVSTNSGHTFDYAGKTYWTSTERTATNVYCLRFSDNRWLDQSKTSAARHVRCIREGDIQ